LGVPLDFEGPFKEARMMLAEPQELRLLAGRAEEAGGLHRHRQAGSGDDLLAAFTVVAPFEQRIPVGEVVRIEPRLAAWPLIGGVVVASPGKPRLFAGIQTGAWIVAARRKASNY
jgi:hypothetical protein